MFSSSGVFSNTRPGQHFCIWILKMQRDFSRSLLQLQLKLKLWKSIEAFEVLDCSLFLWISEYLILVLVYSPEFENKSSMETGLKMPSETSMDSRRSFSSSFVTMTTSTRVHSRSWRR